MREELARLFPGGASWWTLTRSRASPYRDMRIADFLGSGKGNAVTLRQLVAWTGRDERTVRRMISTERKAGTVICADNRSGYYLPGAPADIVSFSRSMAHRAGEILMIAQMAEVAAAEATGQEMLEAFKNGTEKNVLP